MNERDIARAHALAARTDDAVVVLDAEGRVVAASAAARERAPQLAEGALAPELDDEVLVLSAGPSAYQELREGFTAAVSHELRTPLARLLALLESAELPRADVGSLVEQARGEIDHVRELIDDVLFLGELETGRAVVALGSTPAMPVLRDVVERLRERADRAGIELSVRGNTSLELPLRPRMLRVVAENLAQNAIRYAGPGARFSFTLAREDGARALVAQDDGAGVAPADLPRLFERFYRGDRARASHGTGLGLAIVKHIVGAAGGTVEASGAPRRGLRIRLTFPA